MRRTCAMAVVASSALLAASALAYAAPPTVGGCQVFPADNYWNTPIDTLPLHPSSATWVASVGSGRRLHADWGNNLADNYGIPFVTVPGSQPRVPIDPDPLADYSDESDPGPYPIPSGAPIEGGPSSSGDRHVIVVETTACVLYELYNAHPVGGGASWTASSFARWPLDSNALRPAGWTSADAAGLPIFPGLVRWEEVAAGEINHAIRFTANNIWGREGGAIKYLWPARHNSGNAANPAYPPMGARFRLKASFPIAGYAPHTQTILRAMKKYGLVLADGGSDWFFQGVSDTNWPDSIFSEFGGIAGSNFEVVDTSPLQVNANSAQALQPNPDVAVSQTAAPDAASSGKDLVYNVTVSNLASGAATNVVLTNTLPPGAPLIWASPGCGIGAGTVTCTVGTMAAGATATYRMVVRPGFPGTATNVASVSTTGAELVTANNTSTLAVTVNASPAGVPALRYRLYSPVTLEHHFTTDVNEYNVLGTFVGTWSQEGAAGKVLDNPGAFNGVTAVPYYRLYCDATRWHHWTTDANEYYTLSNAYPCWHAEGVDGYILPGATAGAMELYRLVYLDGTGLHHWTIDPNEVQTLTTRFGWQLEPGAGFVIQ